MSFTGESSLAGGGSDIDADNINVAAGGEFTIGGVVSFNKVIGSDSTGQLQYFDNDFASSSISNIGATQKVNCAANSVDVTGRLNLSAQNPPYINGVAGGANRSLQISAAGLLEWGQNDNDPTEIASPNGANKVDCTDVRTNIIGAWGIPNTPFYINAVEPNNDTYLHINTSGVLSFAALPAFPDTDYTASTNIIINASERTISTNQTPDFITVTTTDINARESGVGTAGQYLAKSSANALTWITPPTDYTAASNIVVDASARTIATVATPTFTGVVTSGITAGGSSGAAGQYLVKNSSNALAWQSVPAGTSFIPVSGREITVLPNTPNSGEYEVNLDQAVTVNEINFATDGTAKPVIKIEDVSPTDLSYLRMDAGTGEVSYGQPWNDRNQKGSVYAASYNYVFSTAPNAMIGQPMDIVANLSEMVLFGTFTTSSYNKIGEYAAIYAIALRLPAADEEYLQRIRWAGNMYVASPVTGGKSLYVGLRSAVKYMVCTIYVHQLGVGIIDIIKTDIADKVTFLRFGLSATGRVAFSITYDLTIDVTYPQSSDYLLCEVHAHTNSSTTGTKAQWIAGGAIVCETVMSATA